MRGAGSVARARRPGLILLLIALPGCASRAPIVLPSDPGAPFPAYVKLLDGALDACRRVRTMELAMAITARTPESRLRGDVLAALARPGSLRLVGVAPFGAPAFALVADPRQAVLVLPRDQQYVRGASADALLQTLAGLPLGPADFRAVLTGCLVPDPRPRDGRRYANDWVGVEIGDDAIVYVQALDGDPVVVAGRRPGLEVEYADHVRGLPRRVRVVVTDAGGHATDVQARLSQVNINTELHPDVFEPRIRDDYVPLTLEQFRRGASPLEASADPGVPAR